MIRKQNKNKWGFVQMKSLLSLFILTLSLSANAMPISSSELITEALTNNQDVKDFLEKNTVRGMRPGASHYKTLSAQAITGSPTTEDGTSVRDLCHEEGAFSRSGSILKVEISGVNYNGGTPNHFSKAIYLATPMSAANLSLCK